MRQCVFLALVAVGSFVGKPAWSADDQAANEYAAVAEAVRPGLVRVHYTLKYDKGQAPHGSGWTNLCPNCGRFHSSDLAELVKEERSAQRSGFAISETLIVSVDPILHSRFINSITVSFGDQVVQARPVAYGVEQPAIFLETSEPLSGLKPFAFDPEAAGPYAAVTYAESNASWTVSVQPLLTKFHQRENGQRYYGVPTSCLIVSNDGTPVGMSMRSEIAADNSWKGSPLRWNTLTDVEIDKVHSDVEKFAEDVVLRVALSFRSPRKTEQVDPWQAYYRNDDEGATELNVTGVMIDDRRILIPTLLKPKVTARLERINVHTASGDVVPATFVGSLADYGAFVAELDKPLVATRSLSQQDIRQLRQMLLPSAEVAIQGENRIGYYWHDRISSLNVGWKDRVYPAVDAREGTEFLFDQDGRLVALPIARRMKVSVEDQWGSDWPVMTSANDLVEVFALLDQHLDLNNVPLSEEEENRMAWLGVELQGLDRELARANGVADRTNDGESGALVTYVYQDSPAAGAGIEMGDLLLRLHVQGQPKPVDIQLMDQYMFASEMFPWDQLDDIPEEYFDQIPTPWPAAENTINRKLTDLGFGTQFTLQLWRSGEIVNAPMSVTQSPAHYNSATRYESESLGLTVRDLTYEVRRYFQKTPEEPGVIVSKIEPGGRVSVGGLRPYEVITHVNDVPIMSAADFQASLAGQRELRLAVKRMMRGRIVKIELDEPSEQDDQ